MVEEEVARNTYYLPRKSPLKIPPKWNLPGYKVRLSIIKFNPKKKEEEESDSGLGTDSEL